MIHRLKYLLLTTLLLTAFYAAGQYSIDKVCVGTERYYRVSGELNSTYTWQLTNPIGGVIPLASDRDTVAITWNMIPGIYHLSVLQHAENHCDANIELGTVEVVAQPDAFAGNPTIQCAGSTVLLSGSTAGNYGALVWTTAGDGLFNDSTLLHPIYTPGVNDLIAGNVILTLTASGLGNAGTCLPVVSHIHITLSTITVAYSATQVSCYGQSSGAITFTTSGGTDPYTFTLNGIANSSGMYTNLAAGNYNYSITDSTGCAAGGNVSIESTAAMAAALTSIQVDCFGGSEGSISITGASGGSGQYGYSLDSTNWQLEPLFTELAAGTYTVFIRDEGSPTCIVSAGNIEITQPAALYATATHTNVSIPGASDGSITIVNQSGGSGIYEYSIDGINWQVSAVFTNLPSGTYMVIMRDASVHACTYTIGVVIIHEGLSVDIAVTNVSCSGINDGQALAIVSGGTPPYTYLWSDPAAQTDSIAYNLPAGVYTILVTDSLGNTATASDTITQPQQVLPLFTTIGALCQYSVAPVLPGTSLNGITGHWNPAVISTDATGSSVYIFIPDPGQCALETSMNIQINNQTVPLFAPIGPLCQNSSVPLLLSGSINGITGNWNPAIINTTLAGTTVYTFTPDAGQCAVTTTLSIQVDNLVVPQFTAIGPLCQNSTAPALPANSINGIKGSWNPAVINTAPGGTFNFEFTPDTGQCASVATMAIVINPEDIPVFATLGPLCQNSIPPALPGSSLNGINGTWVPSVISTTVNGITVYNFTPDAGQCAVSVSMLIEVSGGILPAFAAIGPLCLNSIPPALPTTSLNNFSGTWSPALINTSTLGAFAYTFIPDTGQCTVATTLDIEISSQIAPLFNAIGPLCQNSIPPPLQAVSLNGFSGNWIPATISTASIGTTIYTFTPDTGQCAAVITLAVQVSFQMQPQFATLGPVCLNSTPLLLPSTSLNGITGNWSPAIVNTSVIGSFSYTFTPDTGQCAVTVTMLIQVADQISPQFATIGSLCQNSSPPVLPTTSLNGITGSWNPATINTLVAGTVMYTFTPDAGQCALVFTMTIVVGNQLVPQFAAIGPLCQNSVPPVLPTVSLNGITGIWSPATINTATNGISPYTFSPDATPCATLFTMEIEVTIGVMPVFAAIGPLCLNSQPPLLPTTSLNGISGTWTPDVINTTQAGSSQYSFSPGPGQCAISVSMTIEIASEITPAFATVGVLCLNSNPPILLAVATNGITGTWLPALINTSVIGSSVYTFTPGPGQCAILVTIDVNVINETIPVFAPIGPLCLNYTPEILPTTSLNGITGSWNPTVINTYVSGTTTAVFTPDSGQCGVSVVLAVGVGSPQIDEIKTYTASNGLANGYAVIFAGGAILPFNYSLNGTDWQNSNVFSQLLAGTYTAWVRDATGCMVTQQFVIMNTILGDVGVLAGDVRTCILVPIEIPVMAYDFTNIASFTIQLTYDSTIVSFNGLTQINNILNDGNITTTLVAPGVIQITFTADDSITMYNDGLLFNLNFNGLTTGRTELQWNWLHCVIYSAAGYELPAIYTIGQIDIRPVPQIYTDGGGEYCEGMPLKLKAGSLNGQNLRYNWTSPGGVKHTGPEWDLSPLHVTSSGVYQVKASDSTACATTENLHLQVNPNPVIKIANSDTLCSEQIITLTPGLGFAGYTWQDGSTLPQLVATQEGLYWVVVSDNHGCMGSDSALMRPCELLIWMPNAFSPNGDGLNDVFGPKYNVDMEFDFRMLVFNKWGEEIFRSDDVKKGWDGTYKGKPCPEDMYTWIISFDAPPTYNFLQKSPQSGNVMLLK